MQSIVTGSKPLVMTLMGPTACGKTALAMALHDVLPVDVISVDSALVYRGMDIGTAKPTVAERINVPHALVDIRDPADSYNAADFCCDARKAVADSIAKDRIPLLVGGTMMYFKALLEGLAIMPATDPNVRAAIAAEAAKQGWPALYQRLSDIDPDYARTIHPNHSQRISRGLEVYSIGGKTMSSYRRQQRVATTAPSLTECYQVVQIALLPSDRKRLHQCIEKRFETMLTCGFIDEVKSFFQRRDLTVQSTSMRTVGYRQVWQYLDAENDYDTMVAKSNAATRQLAKRQLTWLRRWPNLNNISVELSADGDPREGSQVAKTLNQALRLLPTKSI